jgi:hypothetical protein
MFWFLIIIWGATIDICQNRPEYTFLSIGVASFLTLSVLIYSGWNHYISAKYGNSDEDDD